ncbi:MAG TPA: hypothetical protein VGI39_38310, partial [Polyangiaceae bacterium]
MAQDRAEPTDEHQITTDTGSDPGELIDITGEVDEEEEEVPESAIENLLQLTEDDWDVEEQVKTLQNAAVGQLPSFKTELPAPPKIPSVAIPTPYELGLRSSLIPVAPPLGDPGPSSGSQRAVPPIPSSPSRPPPLPPRASTAPTSVRKIAPPAPRMTPEPPSVRPRASLDPLAPASLIDLLHARVATLEGTDDRIGLARAHLELAVAHEMGGDEAKVGNHAESALSVDRTFAA